MTRFRRIALSSGIELNVGLAGPNNGQPIILLHGFPESHRSWRDLAPRLEHRFRLIMPDLRGFGGSDRPGKTSDYRIDTGIKDVLALADALGIETFNLVGHDIGGVLAWAAAQSHGERIERLAIINAPHPWIFQKSLIENSDQRRASQYINSFKLPGAERLILGNIDRFFDQAITANAASAPVSEAERQRYIAEWSQPGAMKAMLNWYRAAKLLVPPPGITVPLPDALLGLASRIAVPTLVLWGMKDPAFLPIQLDGLERLVDRLTIVRLPNAGHFVPWEAPDEAAATLEPFLAGDIDARAPGQ